ncbi:MAG: hypothetical protein OEZ34_05265 [Spirochaetia bacterium]|nr:hypothetical protein [Spirochaetia bacterium]
MKTKTIPFILTLLILSGNSCAFDSKGNEKDKEEQQAMFLTLIKPSDLNGTCITAQDAALSCMNSAGGAVVAAQYVTILETGYKISIPAPQGSSEICGVLPASPYYPDPTNNPNSLDYKTYSEQSKICSLNCEKIYWTTINTEGNCTGSNYPAVLADQTHSLYMANHSVYKSCIKNCFVTGTVIP